MIVLNQGSRLIAVNPAEISEVLPSTWGAGWSLVIMKGGREYSVNHPMQFVIDQINSKGATNVV
jgi:hypothetical protein